jgi:hypothetical protein
MSQRAIIGRRPAAPHGHPRRRDEAGDAVLAIAGDLVLLQHAEVLGRVVRTLQVGRVEDIAEFVARQPLGARVPGVEFGARERLPFLVPLEEARLDRNGLYVYIRVEL